ncbi:MAG: hypothetical protein IRZ26_06985 [Clostridia bacterium]|nr:hypothetical protein [Clostridia bacterium]MCL6521199.1 hypothetical protein [Bacillota bacterium]
MAALNGVYIHNAYCEPDTVLQLLGRRGEVVDLRSLGDGLYRIVYQADGVRRSVRFDADLQILEENEEAAPGR